MKYLSYTMLGLLLLVLGCQKAQEPTPVSDEETLARKARIERVYFREQYSLTFNGPFTANDEIQTMNYVKSRPMFCQGYIYDSESRVIGNRLCETGTPNLLYTYKDDYATYEPSQALTRDTLKLNKFGFVTSVNARISQYYRSDRLKYDADGYLVEEVYTFLSEEQYPSVTMRHTYENGNRTSTTMLRPYWSSDSVVIVYDYDKTKYNPNIPYYDYPLQGDASLAAGFLADYGKYSFQFYGKPSKNLLMKASCHLFVRGQPYSFDPQRTYTHSYTFDAQKRVDTLSISAKANRYIGFHQRKFVYQD